MVYWVAPEIFYSALHSVGATSITLSEVLQTARGLSQAPPTLVSRPCFECLAVDAVVEAWFSDAKRSLSSLLVCVLGVIFAFFNTRLIRLFMILPVLELISPKA